MKATKNMKVIIHLFILLTMAMIKTNGSPIILNEDINWIQPFNFCGRTLSSAVYLMCHRGIYSSISEEFRSSEETVSDYCCIYTCTFRSLRIHCDEPSNQSNIIPPRTISSLNQISKKLTSG